MKTSAQGRRRRPRALNPVKSEPVADPLLDR